MAHPWLWGNAHVYVNMRSLSVFESENENAVEHASSWHAAQICEDMIVVIVEVNV